MSGRDSTGKIWLYSNTNVWRYDPATGFWTWMNGEGASVPSASWGTQGVEAATNHPGARTLPSTAWDQNGRLWLYGGARADINGQMGDLNDLWRYDSATNQWTWMTGGNVRWSFSGTYGTRNVAAATNHPGSRNSAAAAMDEQGRFLFFGGNGMAPMADIWRYDPATNWWTWIGGSSSSLAIGVYGTQGVPSTSNRIGSRRHGTTLWTREDGTVWLFGGFGFDSNPSMFEMPQNDLWRFQPATNEWTWMAGSSLGNFSTNMNGWRGTYGTKGVEAAANTPGSRVHAASWVDAHGQLWLIGGSGLDEVEPQSTGNLNDVWRFSPLTGQWAWMAGSNLRGQAAVFGSLGVAAAANTPAARQFTTYGVSAWYDPTGSLRFIGGGGSADMWRFELPLAPEIHVKKGSVAVTDGGSVMMPTAPLGGTSQTALTITNNGTGALTGLSAGFSGTNAADFSVSGLPLASLAAGASTTITISFTPSAAGSRSGVMSISSNDADENPYDIALGGSTALPEIVVEQPESMGLTDGVSVVSVPSVVLGRTSSNAVFTVRNTGDAALTGLSISIDGTNAPDFVTTQIGTSLAAGATAVFQVTFQPQAAGARAAVLHISNNDLDEGPFDIQLQATATAAVTGSVDMSFLPVNGYFYEACPQSEDRILLSGTFSSIQGVPRSGNARVLMDGTVDAAFNAGSNMGIFSFAAQADGKIIIGGTFTTVHGTTRNRLARLNADGSLDTGFNPDANHSVQYVGIQPDGKILVGGEFTAIGGFTRNYLARLNPDGTVDPAYNPNPGGRIRVMESLPGGDWLVGGEFTTIGGLPRTYLSRIHPDGTVDTSFVPNLSWLVHDVEVQENGMIVIGGYFSTVDGTARSGLARLNPVTGRLDASFTPTPANIIYGMQQQAEGQILVAGNYANPPGNSLKRMVRLHPDGTEDASFQVELDQAAFSNVHAIRALNDGRLLIHGSFTTVNGLAREGYACLVNDSATDVLTVPSQNQIRWLRGGSAPAVSAVAFEYSSDGGGTWVSAGAGVRVVGGWEINGLNLPANGLVRALGRSCNGGYRNSSSALFKSQTAYSSAPATPEIVLEHENGTAISDGGTRPFGEQVILGTKSLSFTLKNTGTLPLTGLSFSIDGVDAGIFALGAGTSQTELAAGQSSVFTVSFAPQAVRAYAAALHITSNDADEGIYDIALSGQGSSPDIQVEYPTGTPLTDGSSTVTMNSANLGSSSTRTFTVRNNGIGSLSGISATLSGIHAAEYAITTSPALEISQGGSSTFTITFSPAAGGTRTALLSIASNDPDENPFDITLTGSGNAPEIEVEQPVGTVLVDGVASVQLPPSAVGTASTQSNFTIRNLGIQTLSGITIIKDGANSAEFTVSSPVATISPGESAVFNVTFSPQAIGLRTAAIHIASNDSNESPFDIALTGQGLTPPPGAVDLGFPNGIGFSYTYCVQPDGKLVIGGGFSAVLGTSRSRIARLNADNTLDFGFNPGANSTVRALTIQNDGKLLVGGDFSQIAGVSRSSLARLNPDGSLDSSFDPGVNGAVRCIIPQVDGKILIAGSFTAVAGTLRNRIARLNADGTLDAGYDLNPNNTVNVIRSLPDGRAYVGGAFSSIGGLSRGYLVRLNADGTVDSSYNANVNFFVNDIVPLADGKLIIGGSFSSAGGATRSSLARLNADGTADPAFTTSANNTPYAFLLQADGKVILCGHFTTLGIYSRTYIGRINADGSVDANFNPSAANAIIESPILLKNGQMIVPGHFPSRSFYLSKLVNDPATESLEVRSTSQIRWLRGGSAPEASSVSFELSNNGGSTWQPLGAGSRRNGGWEVNGLNLPSSGQIRARARYAVGGTSYSSGGMIETLLTYSGAVNKPEIVIEQPAAVDLVDGSSRNFDPTLVAGNSNLVFTLKNSGNADLTGVSVTLDGANADDFTVSTIPTSLAAQSSTTFAVTFAPSATGTRSAAIHIASNDEDENPFDLTLTGTGISPEIVVEYPTGTVLTDGVSNVTLPATGVGGSSAAQTFTVRNTGTSPLTGISITKDGTNSSEFTVSTPVTSIAAGASATFSLTFSPVGIEGPRSAVIHILSSDLDESSFDVAVSANALGPEIGVEYPTGTSLTDGVSSVALPTTNVGSSSSAQTFTIRNTGAAPLTGISITKDGANSAEFTVSTPVTSIAVGASATLTVTFAPVGSVGVRAAAIHIASSDLDENPFDIALSAMANAPEIEVEQPAGAALVDGVSTVDFGPVLVGSNAVRTFTIRNTGALTLSSLALSKTGTDSANFTLGSLSTTSLAAGGSTTFTVTFAPGATVTRNAVIRVASNDFDENPFDIAMTGSGVAPEITIEQPEGMNLTDGTATTTFGSVLVGGNVTQTFTLRNVGSSPLTGLALSKAGTHTADFTLGSLTVTTLNPGENTTFDVTFIPTAFGSRSAILRVASNDSDENPFDINLAGTGLAAEIAVEQPVGTNLGDGGSRSFGSVLLGTSASLSFTIKNFGNIDLAGLAITKDGTHADDFTVTTTPTAPVSGPSGSTTFTVQFTPSALGTRTAAIHIASNDADENPFDISLSGTGTAPEIVVEYPTGTVLTDGFSSITLPSTIIGSVGNITVTLRNTGTATLTGIVITKDGENSSEFGTSTPAVVMSAGSSATFSVSFSPTTLGTRTAAIHIASSDADENPFDIALTGTATSPEVEIEHPAGVGLVDGISSVDYGTVNVGSTLVKTFTVRNTGTSSLSGLALSKTGTNSTLFTLSSLSTTSLAIGASTTFTVTYAPNAVAAHSATVRLSSNDLDESPFDIAVTGSGIAPEIAIEAPVGTNLTDNASTITFPATVAGNSSDPVTFTVRNTGSAPLTGLALSKVGTNTADFILSSLGATSLAPTESTTFTVVFTPSAGGTRSATLRVASNDADENPFDIALSGTATAPTIAIEQPANFALTSGSSLIDFGELPPGSPIGRTFRIRNTGTAPLNGIVLTKSGANPGDFTVGTPGATTIAPGAFTTFSVIFNPVDGGYRNTTLSIASNATNVSNFLVYLTGAGLGPEISASTPYTGFWWIFPPPSPTELFDGSGSLELGSAAVGSLSATSRSVTIRNDGLLDLTSLAVSISGASASDYSVTALNTTSLVSGATTTITVAFTPGAVGTRNATLHIASNDYNEAPFDISLSGVGLTAQESWRQRHFGLEDIFGGGGIILFGEYEDHQDPDRDGIPNLLEFATGQHPLNSTTPAQSFTIGTGGECLYTYQRSKAAVADGLIFAVQHNATLDPAGWSSAGVTETILSDDGTLQTVQATIPAPTGGSCFTRLRVTRP